MESLKAEKNLKIGLFLAVLGLSGCGHQLAINTHPLPQPFPTQMVFEGSVYEVQSAINDLFKNNPQGIFENPADAPPTFTLYWKGRKHPDEIKIFKNPVNENDVYVSCNANPICKTKVYTDWLGRPVNYAVDFQLHIIPQGEETLLKVIAFNPQVVGRDASMNVQPTTVEENEILSALNEALKNNSSD
ncbi:MAG TPA: hypothetical protein VJ873_09630 [bacterium]|nr:hypothetical protein [bacterium]